MADLGILTRQCPMFEIGHRGEGIDGADTIEGEREIVRIQPSGCDDLDEYVREAGGGTGRPV